MICVLIILSSNCHTADPEMKLNHLIRCGILAFPTVLCGSWIYIFVPIDIRDDVKLIGQRSDGEIIDMTYANNENKRPDRCYIEPDWVMAEGDICDNKPLFSAVNFVDFVNPTNDPRPVQISMPEYDLSVSGSGVCFWKWST
jgi:hypothetical protein